MAVEGTVRTYGEGPFGGPLPALQHRLRQHLDGRLPPGRALLERVPLVAAGRRDVVAAVHRLTAMELAVQRIDAAADQTEPGDREPLPLLGELALRGRVRESIHCLDLSGRRSARRARRRTRARWWRSPVNRCREWR